MEEAHRIDKPVEFGWLIALSTREGSRPLSARAHRLPRLHLPLSRA